MHHTLLLLHAHTRAYPLASRHPLFAARTMKFCWKKGRVLLKERWSFAEGTVKFYCECGVICLRVRSNSLICDVNLIIFGGKLIKLRRKFNNLRRKLKNYSALATKLPRTRSKITAHSQQNFDTCATIIEWWQRGALRIFADENEVHNSHFADEIGGKCHGFTDALWWKKYRWNREKTTMFHFYK